MILAYSFLIFFVYFQVEREMCSASAEFEDFVLQFMDRLVMKNIFCIKKQVFYQQQLLSVT